MKFDLQQSVDFILDQNKLPALRAIELFAFLVALHLGSSRRKICGPRATDERASLVLDISSKTIINAKILAAMKFLDRIEQDWKEKTGRNSIVLSELIKDDPEYEEIISKIILANGSWRKLRFVYSVRALENKLRSLKRQARNVARIIEFSFRFQPDPKKPKHIGGVTMAIDIVTSSKYFHVAGKDSQLEKSWSDLQSAAPFFYLIYVQKHSFFLNKLAGKKFAHRFERVALDQGKLIDFFGQYNSLVGVLRHRGYKYTPLLLPENAKFAPLSEFPFRRSQPDQAAVLDEIENYRKS
jgi:hypothetical protein